MITVVEELSFVVDANTRNIEQFEYVSRTDGLDVMLLTFATCLDVNRWFVVPLVLLLSDFNLVITDVPVKGMWYTE